jgi:hypothetical protein
MQCLVSIEKPQRGPAGGDGHSTWVVSCDNPAAAIAVFRQARGRIDGGDVGEEVLTRAALAARLMGDAELERDILALAPPAVAQTLSQVDVREPVHPSESVELSADDLF